MSLYTLCARFGSRRLQRGALLALSGLVIAAAGLLSARAGDWSPSGTAGDGEYTRASNIGGIINTRHNLTQGYITSGFGYAMNAYRNHYNDVCVYCHTPHAASGTIDAPLWNRTTSPGGGYQTYDMALSSGQTPEAPGPNSLTCLSCHDGTIAIDSIINMPGSGNYSTTQQTAVSEAFLDTWNNVPSYLQMGFGAFCGNSPCYHSSLGQEGNSGEQPGTCMECHNNMNQFGIPEFSAFLIGKDLTNDHPVGVAYPDPSVYDFRPGMVSNANAAWFDSDGNNRPDSDELRLYDSGGGPRVECASCHDPHGVPEAGPGSRLIPSFLRVESEGSTICLTCHLK